MYPSAIFTPRQAIFVILGITLLGSAGCASLRGSGRLNQLLTDVPSHHRLWKPEQAVMPRVEMDRTSVTIRNVRECRWRSETDKDVRHSDWTIQWEDITGVDFIVVPFQNIPVLAHTMMSFRLADGRALCLSVEARLERNETYSPVAGATGQFEVIYVLGDEPDLLGLRAGTRGDDVYLYPSKATPEQAQALLRDVGRRINELEGRPEFYDSLTNNCATNLAEHVRNVIGIDASATWNDRIPGQSSDWWAYEMGLLDTDEPFDIVRRKAWVSGRIRQHLGNPDFSRLIRE